MTKKSMLVAGWIFGFVVLTAMAPALMTQSVQDQTGSAKEAQAKTEQSKIEALLQQQKEREAEMEVLIKTYTLKYISPSEVLMVARPYVVDSTGANNVLTVRIQRKYVPDFEALLKKLDVEKKNILFQVYAIIASKEPFREGLVPSNLKPNQDIENKELSRAMTELKNLWNFKYYLVDDPSFLTVKDGAGSNSFRLVSKFGDFDLNLLHIQIIGDEPGKRTINAGQLLLSQKGMQGIVPLIDTKDISFKEKGFLVVGVSGLENVYRGNALILVMSADIK